MLRSLSRHKTVKLVMPISHVMCTYTIEVEAHGVGVLLDTSSCYSIVILQVWVYTTTNLVG